MTYLEFLADYADPADLIINILSAPSAKSAGA